MPVGAVDSCVLLINGVFKSEPSLNRNVWTQKTCLNPQNESVTLAEIRLLPHSLA